jgi:chemotaxis protein CheD
MHISRVKIADWAVLKGQGVLMTIGLGSCVGIALYDAQNKVGGLAHILLADSRGFYRRPVPLNPAKFADTAIPLLVQEIEKAGGKRERLQAKIAGGSQLFMNQKPGNSVGEKNVQAVRRVLKELGIPIAGEDVGGNHGRTLRFFVETGQVIISTVGRGEKEV